MKRIYHYIAAVTALFTAPALLATETAEQPVAAENTPAVTAFVNKADFLTGKPMADAQYYIYLYSASWCGPCRMLMPRIVDEYANMKANKVEIILIACDRGADVAKSYIEHYKADIPGLHVAAPAARQLPSAANPRGIPHATIVDANGKVLYSGHGQGALNWKKICTPEQK